MTDSIYRLRPADGLCLCVLSLLCLGVLMVESATMRVSPTPDAGHALAGWQWSADGTKQLVFAAGAAAVFLLVGRVDYRTLNTGRGWHGRPAHWAMGVAAVGCLLVLVPHVGVQVNGARRWLRVGPVQLQASELAKWAVVLFLADWLARRPVDLQRFTTGLLPTVAPVAVVCLLVVIQDFGTAVLIAGCALAMLLAGRVRVVHLLIVLPPALLAAFWFVHHTPYRWRRMTAFMDPYANPQGDGYHMIQSLLSFATGGVTGRGLGNGVQKLGYLPEDTTDFIFSVICEELGLFGAILTAALYLGVVVIGWRVVRQRAVEINGGFGALLAFGVACMVGLQAAINMAVATVSVPTKGLSLPLVSAGGTGLVITAAALGLMASVARQPADAVTASEGPHLPPVPSLQPVSAAPSTSAAPDAAPGAG
jgi:cell division protein FtsW